jgi:hypothetical protein
LDFIQVIQTASGDNPTEVYVNGSILLGTNGGSPAWNVPLDARGCVKLIGVTNNSAGGFESGYGVPQINMFGSGTVIKNLLSIENLTFLGDNVPYLIFDVVNPQESAPQSFYVKDCDVTPTSSGPAISFTNLLSGVPRLDLYIDNSTTISVLVPTNGLLNAHISRLGELSGSLTNWATGGGGTSTITINADASAGPNVDTLSGYTGTIIKRFIDQDTALLLNTGVTGSRPTAVQIGQRYFDTTLGIPIWWNGTHWVNASGTTV